MAGQFLASSEVPRELTRAPAVVLTGRRAASLPGYASGLPLPFPSEPARHRADSPEQMAGGPSPGSLDPSSPLVPRAGSWQVGAKRQLNTELLGSAEWLEGSHVICLQSAESQAHLPGTGVASPGSVIRDSE